MLESEFLKGVWEGQEQIIQQFSSEIQ